MNKTKERANAELMVTATVLEAMSIAATGVDYMTSPPSLGATAADVGVALIPAPYNIPAIVGNEIVNP